MAPLLVPVDFSENALEAVRYALGLASQLNSNTLVLYHSNFAENTPEDDVLEELNHIKEELGRENNVQITCEVNNSTLVDGIAILVRQYGISLIVMGITGRNKVGQKLIGSNVFQVSQHADVPVLAIPAGVEFLRIRHAALALPIVANLKDQVPCDEIKAFVKELGADLMIVNVGRNKEKTPKPILYAGLGDIFDMFDDLSPSYHFLTTGNTVDGIANFAKDNHAQLLISIAGKYSFLQGMFKSSVTRKLAYHSAVPLLIYRS